jgi:hypothetical protein
MEAEQLEKEWRTKRASVPIDAEMRFTADGLVLGLGTVLSHPRTSFRDVLVDISELRLLTLLAAAHLRPPTARGLTHIRKAAERWRVGEDAFASMHLALSGLDRLRRPVTDARRLFFADRLLGEGFRTETIVKALDLDDDVSKYSPDQPRVPAGSGRASGQWTSNGGSSGPPSGSNSGERESGGRHDVRTFSVELPSIIACGPAPPVSPFGQAVKAVADSAEIADSVSKWQELGPKGELAIRAAVEAKGWRVLGIQVPVRTSLGLRVEDVMVRVPEGTAGNATTYDGFIEVKVNGGRYSLLQQAKDAIIGSVGGTLLRGVEKYAAGGKVILETGLANVTITYERK